MTINILKVSNPPPPPQHMTRGGILGGNPDRSLKSFPPCYSQTPLQANCSPPSVFLDLRFLQLCLVISTATAGGGGGGFYGL